MGCPSPRSVAMEGTPSIPRAERLSCLMGWETYGILQWLEEIYLFFYKNTALETLNFSARIRIWRTFNSRLPFRISETTLLPRNIRDRTMLFFIDFNKRSECIQQPVKRMFLVVPISSNNSLNRLTAALYSRSLRMSFFQSPRSYFTTVL